MYNKKVHPQNAFRKSIFLLVLTILLSSSLTLLTSSNVVAQICKAICEKKSGDCQIMCDQNNDFCVQRCVEEAKKCIKNCVEPPQKPPHPSQSSPPPQTQPSKITAINPHQNYPYYYKAQTHVHTHRLCAITNPQYWGACQPYQQIVNRYRALGFDFIAITDHSEVTEFDCPPGTACSKYGREAVGNSDQHWTELINYPGGSAFPIIRFLNHPENREKNPLDFKTLYGDPSIPDLKDYYSYFDGIEINNPSHIEFFDWAVRTMRNPPVWPYKRLPYGDLQEWRGPTLWAVASDDYHPIPDGPIDFLSSGWILVNSASATPKFDDIIENIRKGNFFAVRRTSDVITPAPSGAPTPTSKIRIKVWPEGIIDVNTGSAYEADRIEFIKAGRVVLSSVPRTCEAKYQIKGDEEYVQVVTYQYVRDSNGDLFPQAIYSQPIIVANDQLVDKLKNANKVPWISVLHLSEADAYVKRMIIGGSIADTHRPVYICRAHHNGNTHPGKLAYYDGRWSCFIGNGGVEQRYDTRYEGLADDGIQYDWSVMITNMLPDKSVVGGHISDTLYPVYICRAHHNGNTHPGKLAYYDGRWSCFIGNGGAEQRHEQYEVLLKR